MKKPYKEIINYIYFFLLVAFVTTCTIVLFLDILMNTLGYEFTQEEITKSAVSTFLLVVFISLSFATIDYIRRVITVIRPTKEIQRCLNELTHGDFSARVKPIVSESYFGDIANDINKLAKELRSVETLRSDFISNVSHEIKTPLAIIQNYGMLLSDSNLTDEKRIEYAKVITKSSRQLAELVTNILRLNKLENQEIFPSKESFNLSGELCSALLNFEDIWDERNIEISEEAIRRGFLNTAWPGRIEKIKDNPVFIIDGAHNEDGAKSLSKALDKHFKGRKMTLLIGMLKDKDIDSVLSLLMDKFDK